MSAGKLTIVHCLSHLRRQAGREVAAQVQYRGRATASDQQSGTRTHRHATIQASTQVAKQTHTQGTKRETGVSGNGLGNPATTLLATLRKNLGTDLHEIFREVGNEPMNKWLNFGGDSDGDPDHGSG